MKRVVLILLFMSSMLIADGVGRIDLTSKHNYTIIGKKVIYLFKNNPMDKITSKDKLNKMLKKAKKALCTQADTKKIMEQGYHIYFLYAAKESMNILIIENCN